MSNPTLKYRDGFPGHSSDLKAAVERLQKMLARAGYHLKPDGLYGRDTEQAVRSFQKEKGLIVDGIAGPQVWKALASPVPEKYPALPRLRGFRGDLPWIHARGVHVGRAYWPGGSAGITLDPEVDLGCADIPVVEKAFDGILLQDQFDAIRKVYGLRGISAKKALEDDPILHSIRISIAQAQMIFPYVIQPCWEAVSRRFPVLREADTPAAVQTALLSLAYDQGPSSCRLASLEEPLKKGDWGRVAALIGRMQQRHRLKSVRQRRRMEADLIRAEVDG